MILTVHSSELTKNYYHGIMLAYLDVMLQPYRDTFKLITSRRQMMEWLRFTLISHENSHGGSEISDPLLEIIFKSVVGANAREMKVNVLYLLMNILTAGESCDFDTENRSTPFISRYRNPWDLNHERLPLATRLFGDGRSVPFILEYGYPLLSKNLELSYEATLGLLLVLSSRPQARLYLGNYLVQLGDVLPRDISLSTLDDPERLCKIHQDYQLLIEIIASDNTITIIPFNTPELVQYMLFACDLLHLSGTQVVRTIYQINDAGELIPIAY